MLFHELKTTGTISQDGDWFQHISNVKSIIPKPEPLVPMTMEEMMALAAIEEPDPDKPNNHLQQKCQHGSVIQDGGEIRPNLLI
jgi:hypothetical protein